ncbi:ead/Ea22-like family protein [Citrobacter tructae]|uniref:ead/Ea22-like family protein n=1 Tax=Citrobacter tructae TaxID=2562449 RepID=UPI003F57C4A7
MTIDKQALRKRYSAKPTPKCDICGARMTIQRMSGSRVTYGCSGAIYDETGCHYAEGRSLADDHYARSRVTVADESDPDVLALLDELEAAENNLIDSECHVAELEESLRDKQALLEAAEKRIAELREWNAGLAQESLTHQQRIAEISGQKRLIGWRASDYTDETSDPELAKNWAAAIGVLPIFEGDVNTKLSAAGIGKGE